jgi:hypothetical protein
MHFENIDFDAFSLDQRQQQVQTGNERVERGS